MCPSSSLKSYSNQTLTPSPPWSCPAVMESERVELHSARDKMSWAECRPVSILADWRTNDTMTEQSMKEADPHQQLQKWCLVLWRGRQRGWQSGGRSREEVERKEPSPRQLKQPLMASSQEIILSLSLVSKIEKIPPHGLKGKTSCINRRERKHFVNEEPFMRKKSILTEDCSDSIQDCVQVCLMGDYLVGAAEPTIPDLPPVL